MRGAPAPACRHGDSSPVPAPHPSPAASDPVGGAVNERRQARRNKAHRCPAPTLVHPKGSVVLLSRPAPNRLAALGCVRDARSGLFRPSSAQALDPRAVRVRPDCANHPNIRCSTRDTTGGCTLSVPPRPFSVPLCHGEIAEANERIRVGHLSRRRWERS